MMKKIRKIQWMVWILGLSFLLFSCNRADDSDNGTSSNDPLVGYWKLRAVTTQNGSVDASNMDCWKDSYVNVEAKKLTFFLRYQNGTTCVDDPGNFTSQWTNSNGTYYLVGDTGQQMEMPAKLLDNNQTLQVTITENNVTIVLSYRK